MAFFAGALGGLVGGLLALLAGYLADARSRRNARLDLVRGLTADVLTNATMARALIHEYHQQLGIGVLHPPMDETALRSFSTQLIRSGAELSWLLSRSTMATGARDVETASSTLIRSWPAAAEWAEHDAALDDAIRAFHDWFAWFVNKPPWLQDHYLHDAPLPDPTPAMVNRPPTHSELYVRRIQKVIDKLAVRRK